MTRRPPGMLRSATDFAALKRDSRARGDELLVVRVRVTGRDVSRVGFATGRRLGGAVVRNRVRRRLRSIIRGLGPRLASGRDILIVVRPPGAMAGQVRLAASIERALQALGTLQGEAIDG